jgi:hypothetical protein
MTDRCGAAFESMTADATGQVVTRCKGGPKHLFDSDHGLGHAPPAGKAGAPDG